MVFLIVGVIKNEKVCIMNEKIINKVISIIVFLITLLLIIAVIILARMLFLNDLYCAGAGISLLLLLFIIKFIKSLIFFFGENNG